MPVNMRRHYLALILMASIALPASAQACRTLSNETPMLHHTLPAVPDGAVAAEVEISAEVPTPSRPHVEARIISMIAGDFAGSKLIFDPRGTSSCDRFPSPGERGIAVGYVLSASEGVLVIDPVRAPSLTEQRQQNAAQLERGSIP